MVARLYFALQGLAGALWWVTVFALDPVRRATLGNWSPYLLVIPDVVIFVVGSLFAAAASSWRIGAVVSVWTLLLTVALTIHGMIERTAGWGIIAMAAASVGSVAATGTLKLGRLPTHWFFVGPFRLRPATSASPGVQMRRGFIQLVIFWVGFFGLLPLLLAAAEERLRMRWDLLTAEPVGWAGIALFVLATPFAFASMVTMTRLGDGTPLPSQTARELVITGPYAWVRNPMAVAGVCQVSGVGLFWGSWSTIAVAIVGALVWQIGIRPTEEADLCERFGAAYEQYRTAVRCWIPLPPRRSRPITR